MDGKVARQVIQTIYFVAPLFLSPRCTVWSCTWTSTVGWTAWCWGWAEKSSSQDRSTGALASHDHLPLWEDGGMTSWSTTAGTARGVSAWARLSGCGTPGERQIRGSCTKLDWPDLLCMHRHLHPFEGGFGVHLGRALERSLTSGCGMMRRSMTVGTARDASARVRLSGGRVP